MEGGDAAMEALIASADPQELHTAMRLSDSGFEEDLSPTPTPPSPGRCAVSPPRPHHHTSAVTCRRELSNNWHHHYADIGYQIQKGKETQFHPFKCLARQPQVTPEARCKLVSWLIPVHKHFHLSFECCCLAVNIMDRFLASTPVASDCFQLLGVTALLLASKQVEVFSPGISQLLSMCCNAFTKGQLCNLECLVLLRLNYRLAAPTHAFFLDYYTHCSMAAHATARGIDGSVWGERQDAKKPWQRSSLVQSICELTLADYSFNKYPPSLTAGCALSIADELLSQPPETTEHSERVMCSQEDEKGYFCIELSGNKRSLTDSASAQAVDGHRPQIGSVSVEHHSQAVVQDSHSHSLAQECRENLKLLVSLNQEMLQVIEMT